MKSIDINLDIWKWQGCVLVGGRPSDFAKWAKKYIDADVETQDGSAGHAYVEYGKPWLIWVESLVNAPTVAHEALHVAGGVLEARGLKYNAASEEAYTYTMEFIMRCALDPKAKWQRVRP